MSRVRRLTLAELVAGAFTVGVVYLAAVGVFVVRSVDRLSDTSERVERTHVVLRTLEEVQSIVTGSETGVRGFVITGDVRHLEPYRGAEASAAERLRTLETLTSGDPVQHDRLRLLASLVARRFSILEETLELRESEGFDDAAAATRTGRGRMVMDSIRSALDAMAAEEATRLRERTAQERQTLSRATSLIAVSFIAAVILGILAAVVVSRDVDRRLRAEAEARRAKELAEAASRAKSEFLAMMSHELRTPLNSVIGFSNVLLKNRGANLSEKDLMYVQRIKAGGQHLLSLIGDVLDLSKVEAGRMELVRAPVELDELVADTVASFEGQLHDRPITLVAEIPDRLTPIMTDPSKLLQVLTNLIGNAVKFTEQGKVAVRVVADPASRRPERIEVADTGIGIPVERQRAIFDAFEQGDTSTARHFGGTGLGLAVSKSLCDLMGYRLEVHSTVGMGSVFTVHLAAAAVRSTLVGAHNPDRETPLDRDNLTDEA